MKINDGCVLEIRYLSDEAGAAAHSDSTVLYKTEITDTIFLLIFCPFSWLLRALYVKQ